MAIRGHWKRTICVLASVVMLAYIAAYVPLRNRGIAEARLLKIEGMLYDSVANVEKSHDLSTHHSRARIFAPLNAIDCCLFAVKLRFWGSCLIFSKAEAVELEPTSEIHSPPVFTSCVHLPRPEPITSLSVGGRALLPVG
jgi:hypothetical protein